jgi:hypothetical protein
MTSPLPKAEVTGSNPVGYAIVFWSDRPGEGPKGALVIFI